MLSKRYNTTIIVVLFSLSRGHETCLIQMMFKLNTFLFSRDVTEKAMVKNIWSIL